MISQQKFPKNFLWGASTASHQVEGNTVNQWSVWELEHAADLAATAEQRLAKTSATVQSSIVQSADWADIKPLATDPDNYVSGKGVDHYNRFREDFDLLEELHFNAFRFGIEWSRIEPAEGVWDAEAIRHYHDYIDDLLRRGITPVLNIWHWTMPTWFTDKGGFENKDNLPLFDAFVAKIAEEYADKLRFVVTLNEPNVYSSFGYYTREFPPQQKNLRLMLRVYRHLAQAHRRAYAILKAANPGLQVGVAAQLANIQARRPHNLLDGVITKVMRYAWNWWFLNRIRRHQDFVGINYYFTDYYRGFNGKDTPHTPASDLGWYMEPEGLYPLLLRTWARYKKPIIVTENGVADRKDRYRRWWLEQTVIAMQRAMSDGVDLRGYMHWSLLDNFEWAFGWWPKFGLVAVDREHGMARTPRPSALWFAEQLLELQGKQPAAQALPAGPEAAGVAASVTPLAANRPAPPARQPALGPAAPSQPQAADGTQRQSSLHGLPLRSQARAASQAATRKVSDIGSRLRAPSRPRPAGAVSARPPVPDGQVQPSAGHGRHGKRLDLSRLRKRIQ